MARPASPTSTSAADRRRMAPPLSDVVADTDALAGRAGGLVHVATATAMAVICSASTSPTGDILTVFLVGPLIVNL